MRPSGRSAQQMRPVTITRHYTKHAEGSVLVEFGETKVLCNASIDERVPGFLRGQNSGWITAEYGMLPRSTGKRMMREAGRGRQGGRTLEIQRLIGRSLRAICNLQTLGERTITIDCDVIQADGGTRTASITGGYVALADAINHLISSGDLTEQPLTGQIASVSVGIFSGEVVLDLDYDEDSQAETDMNVVMNNNLEFVEIQGTAEGQTFSRTELNQMLETAQTGISELIAIQKQVLGD